MCSSDHQREREKKKKKKPRNRGWRPGSRGCLGRASAWSCAAWVGKLASPFLLLLLLILLLLSLFLSLSLSFLSFAFLLFLHFGSLIIIIFGLEIKSQRLDFHVDATWKKCHISREQPIKIESQKLDLQTLNRVS